MDNAALPKTASRSIGAAKAHASSAVTSNPIDPTRSRGRDLMGAAVAERRRLDAPPAARGVPVGVRLPAAWPTAPAGALPT
ncbi:hypothetical protein MSAS_38710 [Mycobacterium saskatchewanense]|nr:hypothetical protein MSAS_38710 [Mycobacterium saskatchewanense]